MIIPENVISINEHLERQGFDVVLLRECLESYVENCRAIFERTNHESETFEYIKELDYLAALENMIDVYDGTRTDSTADDSESKLAAAGQARRQ